MKCEFKGDPKPDLDEVGQARRLHGGSGFYSFNKPLIPSSVPGPVMGSGASGKWKVPGSVTSCPVPREACVALETLMAGSIQAARNVPSQSKQLIVRSFESVQCGDG